MLRFLAVLLTGLALIAPGAHLYEFANKMALAKSEYAVVQKIYIGWWMAGLLLPIGGGALTLAGPAKAEALQITRGDLPLSPDSLHLRSLKRELRRMYETQGDFATVSAYSAAYRNLMVNEVRPLEKRIMERPHGPTAWSWQNAPGGASRTAAIDMATIQRRCSPRLSYHLVAASGSLSTMRARQAA